MGLGGCDACCDYGGADDAHVGGLARVGAFGKGRDTERAPFGGGFGPGGRRSGGGRPDGRDGSPGGSRLAAPLQCGGTREIAGSSARRDGVFSRRRAVGGCAGLDGVGSGVERDGVVRWRGRDMRWKIEEAFGVAYSDESVRRLLRREGFRFVSGRLEHLRGCAGARSAFRSGFRSLVTARLRSAFGAGGASRPVEVRFQDEAWVGQKGMTSRLWARRAPARRS